MTVRLGFDHGDYLKRQSHLVIGEEGLALASGAATFFERLLADVPKGFSVRLEMDGRDERIEARLTIGRYRGGEVEFMLFYDREGEYKLMPVNAYPRLVV